jgi:serine/threonine protein kinase
MTLKDAKPGRYKPKCSKCAGRFGLTVAIDAGRAPVVEKLAQTPAAERVGQAASALPAFDETLVPESLPRPVLTAPEVTLPALGGVGIPVCGPRSAAAVEATSPGVVATSGNIEATLAPPLTSVAVDFEATAAPLPSLRSSGDSANAEASAQRAPRAAREATAPQRARDATRLESHRGELSEEPLPEVLGGYKLLKELGRGAMGAVYLARQLSLDRNVALKLIQAQWAQNPVFIARFTREAYAAAQLTHHNVVQIYDLGVEAEINFFSMEFVKGISLADLVAQKGQLEPEEAVGYILQAARGLSFAHNHGMVHRDVKPANLILSEHGVVKVADLGLVKTPQFREEAATAEGLLAHGLNAGSSLAAATAEVTMANTAMGTPAYMAPEQAEDASGVDHRADIYSLGCTLYVLLTGRPPFEGASALEVITKHRTQPIVRPEAIVKDIASELSEVVLKMVAKQPDNRYQNLTEVIRALEAIMGIRSSLFSPSDEEVNVLARCAQQFNHAPLVRVRSLVPIAFLAAWSGLLPVLLMAGLASSLAWALAGTVGAMGVAAVVAYFVVDGVADRTALFDRVRSYLLSLRFSDWLTAAGGMLLSVLVLWLFGWLLPAMVGIALGGAAGAAAYLFVDRQLARSRHAARNKAEELIKSLRLKGIDEAAIQQCIVKYSGEPWEEFFESLFGYDAKLRARQEFVAAEQRYRSRKFRGWRDGIIRAIDGRLRQQQELRERKHLSKVEEKNLQAQGVEANEARREAIRRAEALLEEARQPSAESPATSTDPKVIAAAKRDRQLKMLAAARSGAAARERRRVPDVLVVGPLAFLLSGKLRFLVGALLLAGCVMWMSQNGISAQVSRVAASEASHSDKALGVLGTFVNVVRGNQPTEPLALPVVGRYFNSFAPGIAGLILLVLGLFRGWKMSLFAWPAALLALFWPGAIGYSIAGTLAAGGLAWGRTDDE